MQEDGSDAVTELIFGVLPYLGWIIVLLALGFFLVMMRSIVRDANKRTQYRRAREDRLREHDRHVRD